MVSETPEPLNCLGLVIQHHRTEVVYAGSLPAAIPGVSQFWSGRHKPHLPGLVHGFLRIALHLIAGVVCDLGDRLLEDGGCLSDGQGSVQVRLALKIQTEGGEKPTRTFSVCQNAIRAISITDPKTCLTSSYQLRWLKMRNYLPASPQTQQNWTVFHPFTPYWPDWPPLAPLYTHRSYPNFDRIQESGHSLHAPATCRSPQQISSQYL